MKAVVRRLSRSDRERARKARAHLPVLASLLVCAYGFYRWRVELFGADLPVRLGAAALIGALGWALASDVSTALLPKLTRRLEPAGAGVAAFLVRLVTLGVCAVASLRVAGVQPGTLLAGASFTAIVLGLAAQQTFGNLFAGVVLMMARPFDVGDKVRFAGFGMDVEGTVQSRGLLYLTCTDGQDTVMVPNNTALTMSVRPIREPNSVDMRARVPLGVDPQAVQDRVEEALSVPTREAPHVHLEELDGDEVVLRIQAIPQDGSKGGQLAGEVLGAVADIRPGSDRGERLVHGAAGSAADGAAGDGAGL